MTKVIQKVNGAYKQLFQDRDKYRYIILMGGRGAGRSTVASQFALANLLDPSYFRAAIMRFVKGEIRQSIWKEIKDRIDEQGIADNLSINESSMTIEYGKNMIHSIGFRKSSGDQTSKLKSLAGYTTVIIEEADEVPEEDFMQLDETLRTVKGQINIILVLNPPTAEHWIIKKFFKLEEAREIDNYFTVTPKKNVLYINTNYKDNRVNLSDETVELYESYKDTNQHRYYNQILGLIPTMVVGKIYNGWKYIDEIPFEARLWRRGIDFGFSIDPTVIVDIYEYNGGYILNERMYRKGMSNKSIADILIADDPDVLTIADSAEPKSIDEIVSYGVNIIGATKGQGSVLQGIQFVQNKKISITKRSIKTIKAYENYTWQVRGDGVIIQKPEDSNHEWSNSMDAIRYGFNGSTLAGGEIGYADNIQYEESAIYKR